MLTQQGIRILKLQQKNIQQYVVVQVLTWNKVKAGLYQCKLSDGQLMCQFEVLNQNDRLFFPGILPIIIVKAWLNKLDMTYITVFNIIEDNLIDQIGNPQDYDQEKMKLLANIQKSQTQKLQIKSQNNQQSIKNKHQEEQQVANPQDSAVNNTEKTIEVNNSFEIKKITIKKIKLQHNQQPCGTIVPNIKEVSLKQLYAGIMDFRIKVKVIQKSNINQFKTATGVYFTITVVDIEGQTINCAFFNDMCDAWFDKIIVEDTYEISKAIVKSTKYTQNKDIPFQINIERNTTIQKIDQGIQTQPKIKQEFLQIEKVKQIQTGNLTNVVVIIEKTNKLQTMPLKVGSETYKRSFKVYDSTGQMDFTVFGTLAQSLNFEKGQIIAILSAKVGEYLDLKNLCQSGNTQIIDNIKDLEKLQVYQNLKEWFIESGQQFKANDNFIVNQLSFIDDIQEEFQQKVRILQFHKLFELRGIIKSINPNKNPMTYIACSQCDKKVEVQSQFYHCNNCNKESQISYKYMFAFSLIDETGKLFCNIYDKAAQELIGIDATEFTRLSLESKDEIIKEIYSQENRYLVGGRIQDYMGHPKPVFTVLRKIKDDWVSECTQIIKQLNDLI
ncbi:hypothetical protein pb186bvf_004159 [Paramecium bursaria]